jgi:hypothetical protein
MDPLSPDGPVSWIHRIELDASGSLRLIPVWEDGFSYSRGGFLSSHRLLVVGDLLLISRSTAQGRREETLYCRGDGALGPPEDVPSSATTPVPVGTGIEGVSDPMTWPLEPGKEYPMVVGAHPLGDRGILRVGQIYYVGESDTYPEIDVSLSVQIGADTVASARFPLFYEVLDLVGTRALVTHTDLVPRVFLFELNFPSE